MAFMQRQVQHGQWYIVETNEGTDCVPADIVSVPHIEAEQGEFTLASFANHYTTQLQEDFTSSEFETAESKGENEWAEVVDALRDYVSGSRIESVELREGWGARLSAPGYLDCTEWSVFDTEAEAVAYLDDAYGDDDEPTDDDE